jgi:diacylglycerol O-acyltransferase / wax synthase
MLPDPAFFATCLRESFEDLKRAAARVTTVEHPKPVPQLPGTTARRAAKKAARKAAKKPRARKTRARRAKAG